MRKQSAITDRTRRWRTLADPDVSQMTGVASSVSAMPPIPKTLNEMPVAAIRHRWRGVTGCRTHHAVRHGGVGAATGVKGQDRLPTSARERRRWPGPEDGLLVSVRSSWQMRSR